ncbi:MAG: alpha/beta fold hydrolase [Cyanobacteria bacterium J06648_11]
MLDSVALSPKVKATAAAPTSGEWLWRGYELPYIAAGDPDAEAIVLVHGFGGCIGHWRKNVPVLARCFRVYAIDLLGFGAAPKPNMPYTFELWGEQLSAFCRDIVGKPATLVGNSVGAIVVMQAAVACPELAASTVAINCSLRLLHERKRDRLSLIQQWGTPLVQALLNVKPIGRAFFNQIATPKALRNILHQAYVRPEAVTDELIDLLLEPARDPGAADVFVAFISYASGPLAEDLLPQLTCPALIIWGEDDPWEPVNLARSLACFPQVKEFVTIPRAGHCPMDEAPDEVNALLLEWGARLPAFSTNSPALA